VALGRKIRGATDIGEIGNPTAVYRDGVVAMKRFMLVDSGLVGRRGAGGLSEKFSNFDLG
jgi:hypothetical protein